MARYHSLYSRRDKHPEELRITAATEPDGVVMAVEHVSKPLSAVQFHPESILTVHAMGASGVTGAVLTPRAAETTRGRRRKTACAS